MGNRSVTSYDVARRAGVSQSTVSRALRDDPRVVEKTRLRIRALAKEIGVRPARHGPEPEYGGAAVILHDLGIGSVRLLTNNPAKIAGLEDNGIVVAGREPLHVGVAPANVRYPETKRRRMGHTLPAAQN
ncbi:hypothetical protein Y013_24090 [Rhodococcus pyridinivorans SB3094]|uniref:HTH lacI-type domain-containing protein n=1 Tax=Rhodococcus pyridinivorans SB3094 TaxID=1435356 RepID=V9XKI2_9NOCA|nr:hypothetical protein Y013_24090 [Rhodococcus pyridinivorans SB3094]